MAITRVGITGPLGNATFTDKATSTTAVRRSMQSRGRQRTRVWWIVALGALMRM